MKLVTGLTASDLSMRKIETSSHANLIMQVSPRLLVSHAVCDDHGEYARRTTATHLCPIEMN